MKFILLFIFTTNVFAQSDWVRWEKAETDYSTDIKEVKRSDNDVKESSTLTILQDGYSFLISDLDGDNCPFYPTCSSFFVESVSETNILKGTLMLADRFTRDSNLFKSRNHYPIHVSGKLYDPTYNYQFQDSIIIYHSRDKVVR